jgi:hypothetical protein
VAVIYNGSDTVTSCSYTTPPDSTQRDEGFARTNPAAANGEAAEGHPGVGRMPPVPRPTKRVT